MATVIVTLKLIFNLNDHSESVISVSTRRLKDLCRTGQPLFIWDDWVRHVKERQVMEANEKNEATALSTNIDAIKYACRVPRYNEYNAIFRQSLQGPFVELSERWKQRKSGDGFLDDQLPDPLQDWEDNGNDKTQAKMRHNKQLYKKIEQAGKLFRNSTVEHIVHASMFSQDVSKDSSSRSTEPEEVENPDNDSHGNDEEASKFTNIRNRNQFKETMRKIHSARHESIALEAKYDSDSICYTWLVGTCATMIDLQNGELQEEILKLEAIVLGDKGDDPRLSNFLLNLKRNDKLLFQKWNMKKGK